MNKMIVSNLAYRPIRSLISIFAIAIEVTLILLIVGLSMGILNDTKERQQGIGADVMVKPPGSSFFSGLTGAPVSVKIADILRKQPEVAVVSPVITHFSTEGRLEVLYGIDYDSYNQLGAPFRYLEGGPFKEPFEMIVDDYFARANKTKVGDKIEMLNNTFTVTGIVEHGKGARRFMPITTMQELTGSQGKASVFYVRLSDPNKQNEVASSILKIPGMEKYSVVSIEEYLSFMSLQNVPGLNIFIRVVIGISMCIGFLVIFQSMYTAVLERTREIGILKSMGASKAYIVNVILRETMMLAVCGIILGIGLTFIARAGIIAAFPTLRVVMPYDWFLTATIISLVGAALGALYPAVKAARKDPIDALAYE